jgi:hypothetical protein
MTGHDVPLEFRACLLEPAIPAEGTSYVEFEVCVCVCVDVHAYYIFASPFKGKLREF